MIRYILTEQATEDIQEIYLYTAREFGARQADRYISNLLSGCDLLVPNPYLGRERFELHPMLRGLTQGSHILFYRIELDQIVIVRILSSRQDLIQIFT